MRPSLSENINLQSSHQNNVHVEGKNGRLGGRIGETGSRNTVATQKNQLFGPGFLFAPSDSFSLGRTVSPQYIRQPDKRSSYLQELVWRPSWQLDTCASVYKL